MELYIVYNKLADLLSEAGISINRSYVGNYFTSLEMMGITITLMKLDAELTELIAAEAESVGLTQLRAS
jgi:dihydroxyacetone kinase-like protein